MQEDQIMQELEVAKGNEGVIELHTFDIDSNETQTPEVEFLAEEAYSDFDGV